MKTTLPAAWGWFVAALLVQPVDAGVGRSLAAIAPGQATVDVFNYDRFGAVTVYRGRGRPRDVVLLVSGDAGWNAVTAAMAGRLAAKGTIVAGIDLRHYREQLEQAGETCVTPSSDFENLSHYLQSKLAVKKYLEPSLIGVAAGASWVYEILGEAPEGLFKGALSVGFCPELDLKKPLCGSPELEMTPRREQQGDLVGATLAPAAHLPGKWIALQGAKDAVCPVSEMRKFAASVPGSELMVLPGASHDYAADAADMAAFDAAYLRLPAPHTEGRAVALPAALADLPLTLVPAAGEGHGDWFGVFLTGDGGWAGLDKGVSAELARHGVPIVGWDSLKYFWSRRTPAGAAKDLDRVLRYYAHAWGRSHALLIGYSQGADTLPFMFNRLPPATHDLVGFTTLLGISDNALWEFHVATWLGTPTKGDATAPELEHWHGSPYLCIYGESDADAACAELTGHGGTALKLAGGHHFGGGYAKIAAEILSRLPPVQEQPVSSR